MKIIQTFWSGHRSIDELLSCSFGWLTPIANCYSWVYSNLCANRYYENVELYTDEVGKEFLVDTLGLKYAKVHVVLGSLMSGFPESLWATSKICTYDLQRQPFLHIDGDVFLINKLPHRIESAGLVAQNIEAGFEVYRHAVKSVMDNFSHIPLFLLEDTNNKVRLDASNAGLFGGNDIDFIRKYTNQAIGFILNNSQNWHKVDPHGLNCLTEQYLFYTFARSKHKNITHLFNEVTDYFEGFDHITVHNSQTQTLGFLHPLGMYKQVPRNHHFVEKALRELSPKASKRVKDIFEYDFSSSILA